jgi:RNA polymerase sigma factor (sigma-70 family)
MNFPPTRLSVVARTRSGDEETRRLAFATLIEAYWKPAYKYLRLKWRLDADEAADLTQEFFTTVLEKDILSRYDAARARFRTYLRVCLDGFASNARKAEGRLKRGGGVITVPLDFQTAEGEIVRHEPSVPADVDEMFYQEWVRTLFQHAVADLRVWAQASGREPMFRVFERYDLAEASGERPTYADLGRQLGLTATTVTNHLAAMRRQLRQHVLDRLRDLTSNDEEFRSEAQRLFGTTSASAKASAFAKAAADNPADQE